MESPSYDEAIYMVRIKRRRAKEAMAAMVEGFGKISATPGVGYEVLLDYFVNMVYGLELLMKVLAKDWETPGKSLYGHNVGKMYEAIFQRGHSDAVFMKELRDAIVDQKFIYEPAKGLINRVEAIEALWDELKGEYRKRSVGIVSQVIKEVKTDAAFGEYLRNNVDRFTPHPHLRFNPMTDDPASQDAACALALRERAERVASMQFMMGTLFESWGGSELTFGAGAVEMATNDLG